MKIIVGTRGSKLALSQTHWIVENIKKHNPDITFKIKVIKTKGDIIQNVALDKIGDKGIFVKEIEEQLLNKDIDIAVHSMKDMPSVGAPGLKFSYTPKREDPRDALVLKEGCTSIYDLKEGATIGTGSKRRKYQLLKVRPDLNIVPIRGNIDTRIRKIEEENLDGIVLAAAGLKRLGLEDKISYYIPIDLMIPAPAQGALAVQIREKDTMIEEIIKPIEDMNSHIQIEAERAFLSTINGSCNIPIGAYCEIRENKIKIKGLLGDEEGKKLVEEEIERDWNCIEDAKNIGYELAKIILKELEQYEG